MRLVSTSPNLACFNDSKLIYLDADLSWHKGIKNTGKDAEVYAPQSGPNGLIKCEVFRDVATLAHR